MAYITFDDVVRTYGTGEAEVRALDGASFDVRRGELAVIVGASGAGKTTALNILGGMDTATSGRVVVAGHDITHASGGHPHTGHRYRAVPHRRGHDAEDALRHLRRIPGHH